LNGEIVSIHRLFQSNVLLLSEGSPDFDGPSGNLSGTTGLIGDRKTTLANRYDPSPGWDFNCSGTSLTIPGINGNLLA
jgi:hypothetical protein